jgi:multidrug efflux pump subunit AcrA (membrane-fusion protein)
VVTPQETAEKRLLTLAGQSGQHFHVLSGVKASERVVTDGAQRLQPGAAVQVLLPLFLAPLCHFRSSR